MTAAIQVARHRLDDRTREILGKELSERVAVGDLDSDTNEAILAGIGAHALSCQLPGTVLQALRRFVENGPHALVLGNLPTQEFPPSPVTGYADEPDLAVTNAIHLGLIQLLGVVPFAVGYENDGRLIRNVVPVPAATGQTSSWGADAEFFWHTDNPHLQFGERGTDPRRYVPRYLTFYAVRNEERVPTEVVAVDEVVRRLNEQTQRQLRSLSYDVGAPASNRTDCALRGTSVLDLSEHGYRARFDRNTTNPRTREASTALRDWITAVAGVPAARLTLEPGEFLIFDNYRVLHRRRAFTPNPSGRARWLRRCYAS